MEAEVELPPFISLSVMIMLMRMTTIIMMMIMTIMQDDLDDNYDGVNNDHDEE